MVNFNGNLVDQNTPVLKYNNRGLYYADAVFETIRVGNSKIYFWEDHYLRLMASMRILRMEIPMHFTLEYLQQEILKTVEANNLTEASARVRLTVFRDTEGTYLPKDNNVSYIIDAQVLNSAFYTITDADYEVELFKDYYVNAGLLSTLKSANKIIQVVGSVFAKENEYSNCLLLNNHKNVVEALNGNLFLVKGNTIKTPPLTDGCLNGIIRKQLIKILNTTDELEFKEESISPFELQKADELFITNTIVGIQPITKYRKKTYQAEVAKSLIGKLNAQARLA